MNESAGIDSPTFVVEGRWAVEAALATESFRVHEVRYEAGRGGDWLEAAGPEVKRIEASSYEMATARGYVFHRGVFAIVERPTLREPDRPDLERCSNVVIPFGLADPGNLGTVIRSAAAFGVDAILLPRGHGADPCNAKCVRASATGLFRVPLFGFSGPNRLCELLRESGFVLFGTSPGPGSIPLPSLRPGEKNAILVGEEAGGLPGDLLEACDETIRIPMAPGMDSLNVGASAAVVLYEFFRSRESEPTDPPVR